ncbi:inositol monophosphatase family protein [Mucilaginibacter arboris]|uniref:Inositol-1-monophosphatase n=1 Tax=Mucilaginibacter arboris TaxID=2682090 RepID=A0A7K1SU58_9SPHI|nr:inositol monophosphatase family protein [Mucilaginibacter arboris]MVN20824.1 inositol monophosphatase [Mucilaginibacter arboris]
MNLEILCQDVVALAKQAGKFIKTEAGKFNADRIEFKGLNDMVSYVDKTSEEIIVAKLQQLLPEAGFITEEKTIAKVGERYNWVIDPLDGTTNFIHGLPVYSVSIALKEQEELVLGVVYEINQDECFYAWKGAPAYLNGKKIYVSDKPTLADSLIATGFPYYNFEKADAYMDLFKDLMKSCHGLRRLGSAAVDLAYTACGRFDAYYEYNLNDYDMAAGIIIVKQAGGQVFDFSGGNEMLKKRDVIATNGKVSQELLNKILFAFRK